MVKSIVLRAAALFCQGIARAHVGKRLKWRRGTQEECALESGKLGLSTGTVVESYAERCAIECLRRRPGATSIFGRGAAVRILYFCVSR
jgi:hypothetical protein